MQPRARRWHTAIVFAAALLLFAAGVTSFEARPTDVSALRVLPGEVPYRDFWTMYAPGSFVTLALAFALTGPQLIVSNALGIVVSAAAVAAYYRVACIAAGASIAACLASLVAAAFFGTGYSDGLTSYPPAFLLILLAAHRTATREADANWRWAVLPGALLGTAVLFKHDVAGYALIAHVAAVVVVHRRAGIKSGLASASALAGTAALFSAAAAMVLVALGAGPDAWMDLIRFPLVDFRHVRSENLPIVPVVGETLVETVVGLRDWASCNLPVIAACAGLLRLKSTRAGFLVVFAAVACGLHWSAAHVQINTNAISLAAWGGLVAGAGLHRGRAFERLFSTAAGLVAVTLGALLVAEPLYLAAARTADRQVPLNLPGLRGIRVSETDARWMRDLASAIDAAAPAQAPLLFVSSRNDVIIYAESVPFWLSARRPSTRHHEVHPGITDTAVTQRRMHDDIARWPHPVVVREHRFSDEQLARMKERVLEHVAIGATLLDDWIAANYEPGSIYGRYEVMRSRNAPVEERLSASVP